MLAEITQLEILIRLVLAAVLGSLVGFEREHMHRPAGLRTNMLVCVGSALITLTSIYAISGSDPARIAAGIVTGIGFIGAGTIFRAEDKVVGLTTAASLWAVAGIGIAIGAGFYFATIVAAILIFIILELRFFEAKEEKKRKK